MNAAISPEQVVLTALNDFAVSAVEAWKQNDDEAMSRAISQTHAIVAARLHGTDALYNALFRIVREDTDLGAHAGEASMGSLAKIADGALRHYQGVIAQERKA